MKNEILNNLINELKADYDAAENLRAFAFKEFTAAPDGSDIEQHYGKMIKEAKEAKRSIVAAIESVTAAMAANN